ncbi:MAG TPA: type II toxin-antitoxin system RelE/ParE family toxin [Stellaceae bacterium]|nr:type II toxin-antitoxin system RelE/ParE family toxin [Stellaceae bacterium]
MALLIPPEVIRQLAAMPRADRKRLLDALDGVAAAPTARFAFTTQMIGQPGVWRLRKGDWRAVFRIYQGDVIVDRVGHRREVYR